MILRSVRPVPNPMRKKAKLFRRRYETGELYSTIDSHGCKMKRPTGLAVMRNNEEAGAGAGEEAAGGRHHVVVVDIGNDCVRKFRYF